MKLIAIFIGLFISFMAGFYLHDFLTIDTEEMRFGPSHSDGQLLPVIPFEQHRPVLEIDATDALIHSDVGSPVYQKAILEADVIGGFHACAEHYHAGELSRSDMEFIFGDSVLVKIE